MYTILVIMILSNDLGVNVKTVWLYIVALTEPRRAGQVLREGAAGAPTAHAAVPGLERAGQLRLRHQEEETKERTHDCRVGRYSLAHPNHTTEHVDASFIKQRPARALYS